jgi:hypothetical protein
MNGCEAAIAHFRNGVAELQKQECDSPSETRGSSCSVSLARSLLRHIDSAANKAEAFTIFQEVPDRCVL